MTTALRSVLRFTCLTLAAVAVPAAAQEFPTKPIRMVIPYDPGGVSDIVARMIQPGMVASLGQPIIIENRPGAGGGIGTDAVLKGPADGYTMVIQFDSFATVPYMYPSVQYDPIRDFAGISLIARAPQVLTVDPKLGITTVEQFLQYARKKSPEVTFSTAGAGSSSRLSMELLRSLGKFDVTFVTYKGGAPAVNAVLGGQVTGMLASIGVVVNQIKAGKLTALGVSSAGRRNPLLPSVPPLAETVPGFDAQSWIGIAVPASTPQPIVGRLNGAVVRAAQAPDVKEKLESQGMEVVGSTPAVYGEWMRSEVNKWRPLIQSLKIQAE